MDSAKTGLASALWGWALFLAVETLTQIVFKFAGATLDLGDGTLLALAARALSTPVVLLGFVLYFAGFLIWMTILKDVDLGRAYPLTALMYVTTLIAAVVVFHETLTPMRLLGVATIMAGVVVLSSDTDSDRPPPET